MANLFLRSRPTANRLQNHAYNLGDKVVANSSTTGLGMLFEVTTAGTTANSAGDPAWTFTIGAPTTDGGVTWTARGGADIWLANKTYVAGDRVVKVLAKNISSSANNALSTVWECTTGGTSGGSEPSWPTSITAGTTTQADNTVTWTARKASTWDNAHPYLHGLLWDESNTTIRHAAGDTIYVSKDHAESTTPATVTAVAWKIGYSATTTPVNILCVDDTGAPSSPSTLKTTATITYNASAGDSLTIVGSAYFYGITLTYNNVLRVGSNTAQGFGSCLVFDNCTLDMTVVGGSFFVGDNQASGTLSNQKIVCIDTNLKCSGGGGAVITLLPCDFTWRRGTFTTSGNDQAAFTVNGAVPGTVNAVIEGVDFSGMAVVSGAYIVGKNGSTGGTGRMLIQGCKIPASANFQVFYPVTTTLGLGFLIADAIDCDNGATNYTYHRTHGLGTVDHETSITRASGASDGTTPVSWKVVTNGSALWQEPMELAPIATWNDNSGSSKTATIEIITDSASNLNNDDIWFELQSLSAGSAKAQYVNTTKSNLLASNAALSSSGVTWNNTGGMTHPNKMYLQTTFTPGQKGPVRAVVYVGKASLTVYVDPKLTIT